VTNEKWLLNTVGCLRRVKIRTKCQVRTYSNRLFKKGGCRMQVAAKAGSTVLANTGMYTWWNYYTNWA
jgi:hypothetical protein